MEKEDARVVVAYAMATVLERIVCTAKRTTTGPRVNFSATQIAQQTRLAMAATGVGRV